MPQKQLPLEDCNRSLLFHKAAKSQRNTHGVPETGERPCFHRPIPNAPTLGEPASTRTQLDTTSTAPFSVLANRLPTCQGVAVQDHVLCIDASTPFMALALGKRGDPAPLSVFVREDRDRKNSERIGPAIETLCTQAGILLSQIGAVVCGVGPGTFTGTRVAVATAKGLALGLGAELYALDSLSIFAAPHAAKGPGLVVLDARRQELYAAMYGPCSENPTGWDRLDSLRCTPISELAPTLVTAPQWIAGSGVSLIQDQDLGSPAPQVWDAPMDPQNLWLAANKAVHEAPIPLAELDVFYLRASYAEIGAHQPKTPPYRSPFTTPPGG